jgi:DNA polymerase phi
VRCLINHVQDQDRFLNRAADKSLKVLIRSVETDPKLLLTVLPRIIGGYGTYNFDRVTKTKTVEKLLSLVDDKIAIAVIKALLEPTLSAQGCDTSMSQSKNALLTKLGPNLKWSRKLNCVDNSLVTTC